LDGEHAQCALAILFAGSGLRANAGERGAAAGPGMGWEVQVERWKCNPAAAGARECTRFVVVVLIYLNPNP